MGSLVAAPLVLPFADLNPRTVNSAAQGFVLGLPPQRDVGYVTDHTFVVLYLWNGSATDAVLTSISGDDGAEGIGWDVSTPTVVVTHASLRVILDVTIDGPLVIDALITFTSSCTAITLQLTGTRAPLSTWDLRRSYTMRSWAACMSTTTIPWAFSARM